jgi:hypothetical protein
MKKIRIRDVYLPSPFTHVLGVKQTTARQCGGSDPCVVGPAQLYLSLCILNHTIVMQYGTPW